MLVNNKIYISLVKISYFIHYLERVVALFSYLDLVRNNNSIKKHTHARTHARTHT